MVSSFVILVALGIMSPGPAFIHTATHAIHGEKSKIYKVVFGLSVANLAIASIGVIGLAGFLSEPITRTIVTLLGCAYLSFVAYNLLLSKQSDLNSLIEHAFFSSSFILQISNIKAVLFITSAVTVNINELQTEGEVWVFPLITFFISFVWYGLVGILFKIPTVSSYLKPKVRFINKIAALFIIYLVIRMLKEIIIVNL